MVFSRFRVRGSASPRNDNGLVLGMGRELPGSITTPYPMLREFSRRRVLKFAATGLSVAAMPGSARAELAYMPEAPIPAARCALEQAGQTIDRMDAIKTHNPFAVNDVLFSRQTGVPLDRMNNYGCSLVWGHPQAPMGTRAIIELIEELALRGGGYGLFTGCAAGDTAMSVVLEVSDRG